METRKKTIITMLIAAIRSSCLATLYARERGCWPISVIDNLKRNVTITINNYPLQQMVSLAPSYTEILFTPGLGGRVVGVDTYFNYPSEVKERVKADDLTMVGSSTEANIELVGSGTGNSERDEVYWGSMNPRSYENYVAQKPPPK